jgi:hypothetical protein
MKMKLSEIKIGKTVDVAAKTVTISFLPVLKRVKGEKTEVGKAVGSFVVGASDFTEDVLTQAMLHGLSQKFGDELAMSPEEKEVYTVEDAISWFNDMASRLKLGKWNAGKRSGNGKVEKVDSAKLEATELPEGVSLDQALALLKSMGLFKG